MVHKGHIFTNTLFLDLLADPSVDIPHSDKSLIYASPAHPPTFQEVTQKSVQHPYHPFQTNTVKRVSLADHDNSKRSHYNQVRLFREHLGPANPFPDGVR